MRRAASSAYRAIRLVPRFTVTAAARSWELYTDRLMASVPLHTPCYTWYEPECWDTVRHNVASLRPY